MTEKNNLKLWNSVSKTDPKHTKVSRQGGRTVTSIDGHYMVLKATEQFGQIGDGWGYEIKEERFDQGAPIYKGEEITAHNVMHTILLNFWYMKDGNRKDLFHYGHTPYIMATKNGAMTDFDAPKKSLTDAMKKCLSMLGFSADIFLGMYDDTEYVSMVEEEYRIANAENKDEMKDEVKSAYINEVKALADQMKESISLSMLNGLYKSAVRKATYRNDSSMVDRLGILYTEIKTKLEEKTND